jgi:hypothetical protein
MKTISLLFVSLALAVGLAPRASGALLAYEGFEYTAGESLLNQNGGLNWSQPWQTNSQSSALNTIIVAGSLGYTDQSGHSLVTSSNRVHVTGNGSATGDNTGGNTSSAQPIRSLNFARGSNNVTESTWISCVAIRNGNGFPFSDAGGNVFYGRAASVQFFTGTENLSIGRGSQNSETNTALPNDTWAAFAQGSSISTVPTSVPWTSSPPALLLVRIDHIGNVSTTAGNADTAYMWVNPTNLAVQPSDSAANAVISSDYLGATRDFAFNRLRFFGGSENGTVGYGAMDVDEIRIGNTYADVTPYTTPGGGGSIPPAKWLASVPLANSLSLTLTGGLGSNYVIQASTNVADINSWSAIGNLTLDGSGLGTFVDTNVIATNVQRYYRSKIP